MGKVAKAIESERVATLYRAISQVRDCSVALMACEGKIDEDWNSYIRRTFTTVHVNECEWDEYPVPIDKYELPYCGLIILHLDDPMQALEEAKNTIERCKPVVLVECERDCQEGDAPGHFLERLWMRELFRAGPDRIYGWPK